VIVIVADFVGGGFSVAMVGESPTTSTPKIIARSEAKIKKRIFPITVQILPQKTLDNHTPNLLYFVRDFFPSCCISKPCQG